MTDVVIEKKGHVAIVKIEHMKAMNALSTDMYAQLEEAFDEDTPLFERLRFVLIFCSNLDEFFMIRVGSLHDKMLFDSKDTENKTNMTAREQLIEIAKQVKKLLPLKDKAYSDIMTGLKDYGI